MREVVELLLQNVHFLVLNCELLLQDADLRVGAESICSSAKEERGRKGT